MEKCNEKHKEVNLPQKRTYRCLEFLRFFLTAQVFLYHPAEDLGFPQIFDGNAAVSIFFVISGFLLYKTACKQNSPSFGGFAKKQYYRLAVPILITAVFGTLLTLFNWRDLFSLPLMLHSGDGLRLRDYAAVYYSVLWYSVAYFWCGLLLYYILKRFDVKKVLPFLAVSVYFGLFYRWEVLQMPTSLYYPFRAFNALSLGIIISYVAERVKLPNGLYSRIAFTVLECAFFFYLAWYAARISDASFYTSYLRGGMYHYIIAALFLLLVSRNAGYFSGFLNEQKWINGISRYIYPMFAAQGLAVAFVNKWLNYPEIHAYAFVIFLAFDIVIGVALYHAVEKLPFLLRKIRGGGGVTSTPLKSETRPFFAVGFALTDRGGDYRPNGRGGEKLWI